MQVSSIKWTCWPVQQFAERLGCIARSHPVTAARSKKFTLILYSLLQYLKTSQSRFLRTFHEGWNFLTRTAWHSAFRPSLSGYKAI